MLRSPWWKRLWTLQEHVFGRECEAYVGRQSVPFRFLEEIIVYFCLHEPALIPHPLLNYIARTQIGWCSRMMIRLCKQPSNINKAPSYNSRLVARDLMAQTLFQAAFWFQTSMPIDKVYGLYTFLGLCFDFPLSDVDYKKTTADVFEELTWAWVRSRSDLSILKLAGRPDSIDDVPSWVPAWHQGQTGSTSRDASEVHGCQMTFPHIFFDTPFSWLYAEQPEMCLAARNEARRYGPISRYISPRKLQVLRARYTGRVGFVSALRNDNGSFDPTLMAYTQMTWCRAVVLISSCDQREAMIAEFFRSVYMPGIRSHELAFSSTEKEHFEAFLTWFDFMVHLNDHGLQSPILDNAVEHYKILFPDDGPSKTRLKKAAKFCAQVYLADDEKDAVAMLETCFSGRSERLGSPTKLARHIREVNSTLMWMRSRSLCVLDNENMLGVANYWCLPSNEVFVFPGTDTPFVVQRDYSHEGTCYRLVGPVLVDRLRMIGYQKWRAEGDDLRDITLI